MKKFVSMAMVAAMTTSMVPATAFAGVGDVEATAKIVDAWTMTKLFGKDAEKGGKEGLIAGYKSVPELQIKVTDTNYKKTMDGQTPVAEITVSLDNAELTDAFTAANIGVRLDKDYITTNSEVADALAVLTAAQAAYDKAVAAEEDAQDALDTYADLNNIAPESEELKAAKEAYDKAVAEAATTASKVPALKETAEAAQEALDVAEKTLADAKAVYAEALKAAAEGTEELVEKREELTKLEAKNDKAAAAWTEAKAAYDEAAKTAGKVDENLAKAEAKVAELQGKLYAGFDEDGNPEDGDPASPVEGSVMAQFAVIEESWNEIKDSITASADEKAEVKAKYDRAKAALEELEAELEEKTETVENLTDAKTDADAAKEAALTKASAKFEAYVGVAFAGTEEAADIADAIKEATGGTAKDVADQKDAIKGLEDAIEVTVNGVDITLADAAEDVTDAEGTLEAKSEDIKGTDSDDTDDVTLAEAAKFHNDALKAAEKAAADAAKAEADAKAKYDEVLANTEVTTDDEEYLKLKAELEAAEKAAAEAKAALDKAQAEYDAVAESAGKGAAGNFIIDITERDDDEFTFTVKNPLHEGDVIFVDLSGIQMDKTSVGRQATLDVESDDLNLDVADLVYVSVEDYGITATTKKLATVAEEEKTLLSKDLKIEATVGEFADGQQIELKLNNGFEFAFVDETVSGGYTLDKTDDDTVVLTVTGAGYDEIVIEPEFLEIEAVSAKSGDIATITVKALNNVTGGFKATAKVEVAKVVDYTVIMSVEEDEDLPLIYSGTNVKNTGITDDSDHYSLEVTIEESFPGAWSMRKGFNMELPDGVYVTDVDVVEAENFYQTKGGEINDGNWEEAFKEAYRDGDHKNFEFEKRVFDDVNNELNDEEASVTFKLELVADPTFAGDVTLKFTGDLVDEQEVTIAKFMPIAVVEAEQNDMKIDYRYTEIPSTIVVKETADGLWKEGAKFWVAVDKDDYIEFEDDATFEATNGLEIDDFTGKDMPNWDREMVASLGFEVEEESDEAATVTISNMSLFMQRNIPAGAYDLTAGSTVFGAYQEQKLFAADKDHAFGVDCDDECYIDDVADFSDVVKEAFVNVVTAGREQDDASFTTKVVVPVGESYIVAGENTVELDVPAYVSAAGYTMLPVRAVATALGINNNNVIWNGETKTVTILYGQRIITMVAGQKTVNVNGSVIPASAAVEIVDGRTFLPMRDLATALGVTDITWDAATKTATLNGGVDAE